MALLPFARNEATRFISPTKTPEYLAAGRPVVSTSIRDVVTPYGDLGLAQIADEPHEFVAAIESALTADRASWLGRVDAFLAGESWESTWGAMRERIDALVARRRGAVAAPRGIRRVEPAPAQADRRPAAHVQAPAHQAERS